MSDLDEILAAVPISQIARQLGVDEATAESATRAAVPTLLAGLEANAADPAGAASLAGALQHHDGTLVTGGADLAEIDTDDGERIVSNIFGANKDAVVSTLADAPGVAGQCGGGLGSLLPKLLPILAPIVLSWLAKRASGSGGAAAGSGGGGLGDILGSVLGGAAQGSASGASGGGLGDVLGSILGGGAGGTGTSGGAGGGLGDILGGLLGGGKR